MPAPLEKSAYREDAPCPHDACIPRTLYAIASSIYRYYQSVLHRRLYRLAEPLRAEKIQKAKWDAEKPLVSRSGRLTTTSASE